MDIGYDYGYNQTQLNGNIAGIAWMSKGDPVSRAYGFGYDNTSRLSKGDFTQNNGSGYEAFPENRTVKIYTIL